MVAWRMALWPVLYDHLEEYGIHRHAIAPAIRELVALGFVEVMRRGCALNGDLKQASLYRITYRNAKGADGDGTHEWRKVKTIEQAEALAKQARAAADSRSRDLALARSKNKKPVTVSAKYQ